MLRRALIGLALVAVALVVPAWFASSQRHAVADAKLSVAPGTIEALAKAPASAAPSLGVARRYLVSAIDPEALPASLSFRGYAREGQVEWVRFDLLVENEEFEDVSLYLARDGGEWEVRGGDGAPPEAPEGL